MVGRGGGDLGLGRAAVFRELPLGPAAGHDQPGALRRPFGGGADAVERLGERAHADPVHLGGEGEAGADGVDVGIDQARE